MKVKKYSLKYYILKYYLPFTLIFIVFMFLFLYFAFSILPFLTSEFSINAKNYYLYFFSIGLTFSLPSLISLLIVFITFYIKISIKIIDKNDEDAKRLKIRRKGAIVLIVLLLFSFIYSSFISDKLLYIFSPSFKMYAINFIHGIDINDPNNAINSPDEKYAIMGSGNGLAIYDFGFYIDNATIKFYGKGDGLLDVYGSNQSNIEDNWIYYGRIKMGECINNFSGRYIMLKDVKTIPKQPWIVLLDAIECSLKIK
jgi:hypothetical protein